MKIDGRVQEAVGKLEKDRSSDTSLSSLRDFYAHMKREGLVLTKGYDLPLVDTIGSTARAPRKI